MTFQQNDSPSHPMWLLCGLYFNLINFTSQHKLYIEITILPTDTGLLKFEILT